jgi:hypothetical protein
MPLKRFRTIIELLFLWVLPFAALAALYPAFSERFSPSVALFTLLFPAVTMYWVVGTGAGYCKFWYFTTSYSIKGVTPTIGLIYSAVINTAAYMALAHVPLQSVSFVVLVGIGTAVLAIFIDIFLLGSGLFYLKSKKHPLGSNPVKHAFSYGSWFFTLVGMWNAVGIWVGHQLVTESATSLIVPLLVLPLLFAAPFMIYFIWRRGVRNESKLIYGQ